MSTGLDFIEWEDDNAEVSPEYKVEPAKKTITIFQILRALTETKEVLDFNDNSVSKGYNQFMVNKWLSMNEFTLMFVEDINNISGLTDEQHFTILHSLLPQRKFYYDYSKKSKKLSNIDYKYVADYYQIGMKDAVNYIRVMSDEDINGILDKYRYGKNGKQIITV